MSTTPKHDAAPWTLHRDQSGWYVSPIEALLPTGDVETGKDEDGRYEANARLVTAAPNLYDALKAALTALDWFAMQDGFDDGRLAEQARAALALADPALSGAAAGGEGGR